MKIAQEITNIYLLLKTKTKQVMKPIITTAILDIVNRFKGKSSQPKREKEKFTLFSS